MNRRARFGMFIHWGVYSVIGKGERIQPVARRLCFSITRWRVRYAEA